MQTKTVTVTVKKIKPERGGRIVIFIFREDGFPKNHCRSILKYYAPADKSEVKLDIDVPVDFDFALKVLHDERLDERVKKNWTGILPKSGLGFSNGARIRFGPPKFANARIRYDESLAPKITMKYL